jgi:hypothetical protein
MSGTLELAAGVFAVIGVADVALRTGRDVYGFLHKIADAPNEIEKLCVIIREITLLAETSKELLEGTSGFKLSDTTHRIVTTLEVSLKSFNCEIQSLKVLSTRFRDTNKSWSRVRYVLDERKINKALDNLERSKSLLGNVLMLACKYVSTPPRQTFFRTWLGLAILRCRFTLHTLTSSFVYGYKLTVFTTDKNLTTDIEKSYRDMTHMRKYYPQHGTTK